MNGDFLCNKGRYAFDFANHDDRLTKPLVRNAAGKLEPVTWEVQPSTTSASVSVNSAIARAARASASSVPIA